MSAGARPTRRRSREVIAKQWDKVAQVRDAQIRAGQDVSYEHVLTPTLLRLAKSCDWRHVLDVGCGTGVLAELLGRRATSVLGVDPSRQSIAIAEASAARPANVKYVNASVEEFAEYVNGRPFTLAIANMVLQDTPTLDETLSAIAHVLRRGGMLVSTITHPCFWPVYWGYERSEWFEYTKEIAIEAPFRISAVRKAVGVTTHFHRPISQYTSSLYRAGFQIESVLEPMPSKAVEHLYPHPWQFPRFLAFRCRLSDSSSQAR